jgi:phosphopantothenoylcysteine decarboxylase / phosphopantothenate---cysteine ligase
MPLSGKRVLLIIGGGIAAYKSLELIREVRKRGGAVRAILTKAGAEFVTPLSVSSLSGEKVFTDLFSLTDEAEMGHIELSRAADLVVVAPATADLLAKMAQGLANDLASTALLATDKRVLVAPAMNVRMWDHPATRRNIATLKQDGVMFVGPDEGEMACGEYGFGRMAEPPVIADAIEASFAPQARSLAGRHVLVTSGPTFEPLDPVRFIANRSSGKQGHAIAAAAARAGAKVTLVSGPVAIPDPAGVTTLHVETAREMLAAVEAALPADCAIFCAAVADWRPVAEHSDKLKKGIDAPSTLELVANPDILSTIAHQAQQRPPLVIGFAAETANVLGYAQDKLAKKACDLIVANDVGAETGVMGGDLNTVHIVSKDAIDHWPKLTKDDVAERLVALVATKFASGSRP